MAINKAIIQIRRGPKDDLQFDKLLPGELAIATDAPCMWFCWAVGEVEQIPTSDNIEEVIAEIIEKYLKDNPVTGISEIYMRVYEGYIQYSSDGETYNDLISVSELKGAKGDPGSAGVGIRTIKQTTKSSEDGGTNVITITLSNDTKVTFDVLNGQKGSPGNAGVGIQSISQQTGNLNGGKNTIQIVLTNGNVQEVFTYNGKNGSDANVTLANIVKALGFTPASEEFVNNQVSTIPKFELEVVDSLPTANIKETTVYLLKSGDESDNLYTEYIYKNGKWEKLGSQTLDLSKYAEKSTTLKGYGITDGATKEEVSRLSQEKADYQYVDDEIADLKAQGVQQTPLFAKSVEECTDTSKVYVLPDGYIYGYTLTKGEYTNILPLSTDADGNIYNTIGYKSGYRINSSGNEVVENYGMCVTGFLTDADGDPILFEGGETIRIKNMTDTHSSTMYIVRYYENKTFQTINTFKDIFVMDGDVWTGTLPTYGNPCYIRFSIGTIDESSVITVNEEIVGSGESGYKWISTGRAFVPADYEDRIIELETQSVEHESRLKELESCEKDESIPDYWKEELETKADAIQVAMENAGWNKSSFLYYTDAHWDAGNSKMSPLLLKYLFTNTSMNKTKFGGDIIGDPSTITHDTVKHLYDEWIALMKGLNQDSVLGNHDNLHKGRNDSDVANIVYSFLLAPEEKPNRVMGGDFYYYVDEPCEKTRYLHLDSGRFSLSDEETEFIIDVLKNTPDGWHIVVISHIWFQYTSSSNPSVGNMNTYMQKALDLFDAYNARQGGSITMMNTAKNYDFTSCGGKVEFCIGGHIHIDLDLSSTGGIPVILTASDVNQERSTNETEDSGTLGTITESAVYGIVADYKNNKISVIGVGRGGSREITI